MAVFRIEKTRDYTVMSNHHLKDRTLTLKSKGLLSMMLSLPDEWNYTTRGLAAICREGVDSIGAALKELETHGYIRRTQLRDEKGKITDTEYVIYEMPQREPPSSQGERTRLFLSDKGYLRSPEDKQKLIIDEEPATVVRRIYQMVIEGKGVTAIADILTAEKVLIPSAYAKIHCPENDHSKGFTNPYLWSATAVSYILEKQEYMGHTVLGKTISVSYKTKKRRKAEPDELMIFKNTHPAIVDEETWHLAQKLRKTVRKPSYNRPPHPLTGLVYCADCGSKMTHRQPSPTKKKKYDADDAYICGSYRQRTKDCTMHFIKTSVLWELILTAIREVSDYVRQDEQAFIDKVQQTSTVQMAETQREQKRRLAEATERNEELNTLIKKLYEGNATGKIPDKHFERLLADYDREQTALETEIEDLQEQIDSFNEDNTKADKFIAVVRRYTDFTELTTPMLNEFIEKVVVHEATGGRTDRKQKIDVYFNFVGQVELPPPDRA